MKLNDRVAILFWDHCQGSEDPLLCEIFGRVVGLSKLTVTIASWDLPAADLATRHENWDVYAIVRSTIRKVAVWR